MRNHHALNPTKGKIISEETKNKISQKTKGKNNPRYGVKIKGTEIANKISKANKGKKHSKIHSNKGVHISEKTKQKISKANSKPKPQGFGNIIKQNRNHKLIGEKNTIRCTPK